MEDQQLVLFIDGNYRLIDREKAITVLVSLIHQYMEEWLATEGNVEEGRLDSPLS